MVFQLKKAYSIDNEVVRNPKKLRAVLLDLVPSKRVEINLLTLTVEAGIAEEIAVSQNGTIKQHQKERWVKRLTNEWAIDRQKALWAIECWCEVFGVVLISKIGVSRIFRYKLRLYWLLNTSSSMQGNKIVFLNRILRDSIPLIQKELENHYRSLQLMIQVIKFSDQAEWVIKDAITIDEFEWKDLKIEGSNSSIGSAINLLVDDLNKWKPSRSHIAPIILLLTDRYATDDFAKAMEELNKTWSCYNTRVAIGIGNSVDKNALCDFACEDFNDYYSHYMQVNNSKQLNEAIHWLCSQGLIIATADRVLPIDRDEPDKDDKILNDEDWFWNDEDW